MANDSESINLNVNESMNLNDTGTESVIMNGVTANSTPVGNKVSLDDMFQLMKSQSHELNVKFDEKFNEMKNEIQRQNCHIDKRINEILARLDEIELENKR